MTTKKEKSKPRKTGKAPREKKLYAVIGIGRFGFAIAEDLAKRGQDVIAIDIDRQKIDAMSEFTPNAYVVKDLTADNLLEAGVAEADVAIIGIGSHLDTSVLTTMTVLKLGVKRVIAKATSEEHGEILKLLGAEVVYPEHDMAIRLATRLCSPNVLEYISLSEDIDIMEINLTDKAEGKSVLDLNVRRNFGINIIALKQSGKITVDITPDIVLGASDTITVIGKTVDIGRFEESLK